MDPRIIKTLDFIESKLNTELNLDQLADFACMSASHFHKTFKKETGNTPFQFIEKIKMEKAFQILSSGSGRVGELALELGYNDYETFSRSFKKHHHVSPDDLRAISQKIKNELVGESDDIIIKTFEVDSIDELDDKVISGLEKLIEEKGYSKEELEDSKIMSVLPLDSSRSPNKEKLIVKNKFEISKGDKIWKTILKREENGSD